MCPHLSLIASAEDSNDTSESGAESLLLDEESVESDDPLEEGAEADSLSLPLRRGTHRKRPPPGCHLCDHDTSGGDVTREMT